MLSHSVVSNSIDCNPPGSSDLGIAQARILAWVAIPSSRGSSQPRDQTQVSHIVVPKHFLCHPFHFCRANPTFSPLDFFLKPQDSLSKPRDLSSKRTSCSKSKKHIFIYAGKYILATVVHWPIRGQCLSPWLSTATFNYIAQYMLSLSHLATEKESGHFQLQVTDGNVRCCEEDIQVNSTKEWPLLSIPLEYSCVKCMAYL